MINEENDERYRRGVEAGLEGDALDDIGQNLAFKNPEGDLYDKGYKFGREHRASRDRFNFDNKQENQERKYNPKVNSQFSFDSQRIVEPESFEGRSEDVYPDNDSDKDFDMDYSQNSDSTSSPKDKNQGGGLFLGLTLFVALVGFGVRTFQNNVGNLTSESSKNLESITMQDLDKKLPEGDSVRRSEKTSLEGQVNFMAGLPSGEWPNINYERVSNLTVTYFFDYRENVPRSLQVKIPDNMILGDYEGGMVLNSEGQLVKAPVFKKIDLNNNNLISSQELDFFSSAIDREMEDFLKTNKKTIIPSGREDFYKYYDSQNTITEGDLSKHIISNYILNN